jgi:cytochrome P450
MHSCRVSTPKAGRAAKRVPVREWVSTARAFAENRVHATQRLVMRHGHLIQIPHVRRIYIATHPEDIEHVLVSRVSNFRKSFDYRVLADVMGEGLLTTDGDAWMKDRRMLQPFFHAKAVSQFFSTLHHATAKALERFARMDRPIPFSFEMQRLALEVMGGRLFGDDIELDAQTIYRCTEAVQPYLSRRIISPFDWRRFVWTPARKTFNAHIAELNTMLHQRIAERRGLGKEGYDLLSMLLAARDENGRPMSEAWVRDHVITTFLAGHETTAASLCWLAFILATRPDVQTRAQDEVDAVLGDLPPTYEDLNRLSYLKAVVQETLRLFPSVPTFGREAIEEDRLGDSTIPAKSTVAFCSFVTQRHPDFFSEPNTFDAERFLGSRKQNVPRFAYLPFASGQRMCIGAVMAEAEMIVFAAMLLRRFHSELAETEPVSAVAHVSYRPKGALRISLRERSS